jgi:hypothetical protein
MLQKIETCQPSDKSSCTKVYQKHVPINSAYHFKYSNEDFQPPREYSGLDAARVFYEKLKEDALHIAREYYDKIVPLIPLTENEKIKFKTEKVCHICEEPFDYFSKKVVDHDHLTGKFRGVAHL